MRRYLLHLAVLVVIAAAPGHVAANGRDGGGGLERPSAAPCDELQDVIESRGASLQGLIEALNDEVDGARGPDRAEVQKQLNTLRTRANLLEVAGRRIDRGRLTERECQRIETFLLKFISLS